MWSALRDRRLLRYKFRRQHPVGDFIVDFACTEYQLVIEVNGGQHSENAADTTRTAWLQSRGWRVLRFWNNDILQNRLGVLQRILEALGGMGSGPSPASGGGKPAQRAGGG